MTLVPVIDPPRKFGPKAADHPSIGVKCSACDLPFRAGDYTTLIAIGPGDDKAAQAAARAGKEYNAIAIEVHWSCATGEP